MTIVALLDLVNEYLQTRNTTLRSTRYVARVACRKIWPDPFEKMFLVTVASVTGIWYSVAVQMITL